VPVRTAASLSAEADQWKQRSAAAQPATARGNLRRPVAVCFRYSRPDFPHGLAVSAPARVRLAFCRAAQSRPIPPLASHSVAAAAVQAKPIAEQYLGLTALRRTASISPEVQPLRCGQARTGRPQRQQSPSGSHSLAETRRAAMDDGGYV
jgi:hypothetical protein